SIKDNKKLYKKTTFCLKISLKLMDVGYRHIAIKLRKTKYPKTRRIASILKNPTLSKKKRPSGRLYFLHNQCYRRLF
ncbi:hypothetical protein ACS2QN_27715, partial [Bacillus cereus group sp. Bce021]|uniref:hypothetical protein n=1 Tax=Bacillus cereus group sp. Bce021 TaxID=3445245 RepID=UPI003F246FE6